MTETLSLADIEALATDCLKRAGVAPHVAACVAAEAAASEAAGLSRHGLRGLLRDLRLLRYGRLEPAAVATRSRPRPGLLIVDAEHGFAAAALDDALSDLGEAAGRQGIALLRLERASAPGGMLVPLTRLSDAGFAALAADAVGTARCARPGQGPAMTVGTGPAETALTHLLGLDPKGETEDSPIGPRVAHRAWLVAADPDAIGPDLFAAAAVDPSTMPTKTTEIALPADLLEQIVTA